MPANNKPGTDWGAIKRQFEAGVPARRISDTLRAEGDGPSHVAIGKRARKEGWKGAALETGNRKPLTRDQRLDIAAAVAETDTAKRLSDPQTRGDKILLSLGKRTPDTAKEILERVRQGASPSIAAQACGISTATLSVWRQEDPVFNELIAKARAELLGEMQSEMPKAARRGDWKAADRILQVAPETREEYRQQQSMGGLTVVINVDRSTQADVIDITPTEVSTHA